VKEIHMAKFKGMFVRLLKDGLANYQWREKFCRGSAACNHAGASRKVAA
jgi:hypothetical protein